MFVLLRSEWCRRNNRSNTLELKDFLFASILITASHWGPEHIKPVSHLFLPRSDSVHCRDNREATDNAPQEQNNSEKVTESLTEPWKCYTCAKEFERVKGQKRRIDRLCLFPFKLQIFLLTGLNPALIYLLSFPQLHLFENYMWTSVRGQNYVYSGIGMGNDINQQRIKQVKNMQWLKW